MSKTNRIARRARRARGAKINHEEGVLDRKHLFESNLDRIEQTRRDALACGMDDPVVICGDATDPTLRGLVDARYGGGAAEQLIRHHRTRRETPTVHLAVPRSGARELFAAWSPSGGRFIDAIPDGMYGVAVVMGGGNLYAYREA